MAGSPQRLLLSAIWLGIAASLVVLGLGVWEMGNNDMLGIVFVFVGGGGTMALALGQTQALELAAENRRGLGAVAVAWILLALLLLFSAWFFAEVWLPTSVAIGCFDGWEEACSAKPTPSWISTLRWALWTVAAVSGIATVVLAHHG